MYFRKMNFVNGKYYKFYISGIIIGKLVLKFLYDSNGKWGFIEM